MAILRGLVSCGLGAVTCTATQATAHHVPKWGRTTICGFGLSYQAAGHFKWFTGLMRWFLSGKPGSASLMLDRLNALSDGVIAIVLTLLVLGIEVPKDHNFSRDGLVSYLLKIEYEVTVYAVSFVLIGTYWMVQNVMFHYFRHGTRTLSWLNLLFLFVLTLVPFTTALIGDYKHQPLVMVVYGAVNIACSLALALMWWYANHRAPVVWPRIDPAIARSMMLRILCGAGLSLVAICVSFLNVRLSHTVFLMTPLLHFSHQRVDSHWSELVGTDEANRE